MHSIHWSQSPEEGDLAIVMHHNGDFSGGVKINIPVDRIEALEEMAGYVQVCIPFEALKTLVGQYVAGQKMSALEEADDDDILFGRIP